MEREVASHYNKREDRGTEERKKSPIFHMKAFNNWTKSLLISKYSRKGDHVLDIGCGKGGDLLKWQKARISSLLALDIAAVSIEHAEARYKEGRGFQFKARFKALDCFSEALEGALGNDKFDLCSVQFALHYAFENEAKVRVTLKTIAASLIKGGSFLGTIPNSRWIVKMVRNSAGLEFGNPIYSIKFEQKEEFPIFGHKYWFRLEDAIDDCPEFLIHMPTFERIALEYGLKLVLHQTFHEFFDAERDGGRDLLQRMRVFDEDGRFSAQDWEAAGIYSVFCFEKVDIY